MDELLDTLGKGEMGCLGGAEVIGFADDIMIIIPFNHSSFDEAFALANKKMERMRKWSESKGLKINPSKTAYAIMHRGNSDLIDEEAATRELTCDGKTITRQRSFRYLGIWMDEKMTWNRHLEEARKKGCKTLIATARMLGKTYGLSPLLTKWVYKSNCLPRMTYACFAWWDGTPKQCNKLEGTRSVAMRMITGAMRAAPLAILEGLTGLPKVCDVVEQLSANTAARLQAQGRWPLENQSKKVGHHQSALMSAKGLTLPVRMLPQWPIGSHPFRVRENSWETNPLRRPYYTYILKDSAQKNMRWLVRGSEVYPLTTRFKCNYRSALALQHAIESTGLTPSRHYATDDAILINQAKQRYLNPTLLDCVDKLEKAGATRAFITRCPSLSSAEMQGVYNAIVSQISISVTPIFKEAGRTIEDFKADSKERLNKSVAKYWTDHLVGDRCQRNLDYLKHSKAIFRQLRAEEVREIMDWDRRDIRLLACLYSGRMLDKKITSKFTSNYGACTFCGEDEANHLQHWMGSCNSFDQQREDITQSGTRQVSDISPEGWIAFAKECGFAKFAFTPTA
jgi:Reverse transcriptase (RNA-dependent DNA polymerase)